MSENGLSVVYEGRKVRKCPRRFQEGGRRREEEDEEGSDTILKVVKRALLQGLINILFEMTRGFGWGLGHGSGIRLLDAIYGIRH